MPDSFLEQSLACKHVLIQGIYTHFANSEDPALTHARQQLDRFQEVLHFYEKRSLPTPMRHMANSVPSCSSLKAIWTWSVRA
jgi:alanine racemase